MFTVPQEAPICVCADPSTFKGMTVYAIVDPRDNLPRYIGCSAQWPTRAQCHNSSWRRGKHGNLWLQRWRDEVAASGQEPQFAPLAYVGHGERGDAERAWIAAGRRWGWPLVNVEMTPHRTRKRQELAAWRARTHAIRSNRNVHMLHAMQE